MPIFLILILAVQVAMLVLLILVAKAEVWIHDDVIKQVDGKLVTLAEEVRQLEDLMFTSNDAAERDLIRSGYELMKGLSVVFATLVRDSREAFSAEIPFIERTGKSFSRYRVLCLEEGSVDGTREMLDNWSRNNPAVMVRGSGVDGKAATAGGKMASGRYVRMAALRNAYLRMLRKDSYFGADMLIVVDSDLSLGWDVDGIAHSFGLLARAQAERSGWPSSSESSTTKPRFLASRKSGDTDYEKVSSKIRSVLDSRANMPYWDYVRQRGLNWTAVCSNGRVREDYSRQYDSIAFRNAHFTKDNFRHHQMIMHSPYGPPEFVDSCFGGLAIYNISVIGDCEYDSTDCEHVPFHECLAQHGGRMVFNPRQVLDYDS